METDDFSRINVENITANGVSMDYIRFGKGAKNLVIIPGLSVQSVMGLADPIAAAYHIFTEEYTVFLFDRRRDIPEGYTVSQMAHDTACVISALGIEHFDLFGTSQGGMISLLLAAFYPEMVNKLVVGSSAAYLTQKQTDIFKNWVRYALKGDSEALYMSFGRYVYPAEVFEQSQGLISAAAKTVTQQELERFVILANSLENFDIREKLSLVRCPVLAIGDKSDMLLGREGSDGIISALTDCPHKELYIYDGFGHAAYDTAPDYKQRILGFFRHDEG